MKSESFTPSGEPMLSAAAQELSFLRAIEAAMPQGVFAIDADSRLIYVNDAFRRAVGWSRDALVGQTPPYPFWPPEREAEWQNIIRLHHEGKVSAGSHEVLVRCRTGDTFWAALCGSPLNGEIGVPDGLLFSLFDITVRKRIEEELRSTEAERRALYQLLVNAQDLERRRIAAELHDSIGSGLTAIKVALDKKLQEPSYDPETGTSIEKIIEMVRNLAGDNRRISQNLHPSIIDDLGVCAALKGLCRENGELYSDVIIELSVDVPESSIPHDRKLVIYRIVQEALNNALKYSGGHRIEVRLGRSSDGMVLSISDNGQGMDASNANTTDRFAGGAGLKNLSERTLMSGGRFDVESPPGGGTTVRAVWAAETPATATGFAIGRRDLFTDGDLEASN